MKEDKMRKALESITNSTCCECCQEAARVAKQALAPEPRLYVGQQMLFGGQLNQHKGILEAYDSGSSNPFKELNGLSYCKAIPDPDAKTRPVWVEHDGGSDMPMMDDEMIAALDKDGEHLETGRADEFDFGVVGYYAIIEPPEFIE